MKPLPIVILFALLHLVLANIYSVQTPYRQAGVLMFQNRAEAQDIGAPDERQHANYVQHLLEGKGFPVFDPKSADLYESYQSHQPPLYYVIGAGVLKLSGVENVSQPTAGKVLRFLNSIIGSATVFGLFFLGLWGFRRVEIGLFTAAFGALLPMNLALSGAVTNDPLVICLLTWALALASKGALDGWTVKIAILVGLLAGLAMLTKSSAIVLLPVLLVPLFKREDQKLKFESKSFAIGLATCLLLALPWWLRNQNLYGDPLALKAFSEAFTGTAQAQDFINGLGSSYAYWTGINPMGLGVGWWTLRSFFGAFGYMDIFLPSALYAVLAFGLLFVFLAGILGRRAEEIQEAKPVRMMLTVFFLLVLVMFIRFNSQYFQAQARYLLPALGSISVAVACGWYALFKNRANLGLTLLGAILLTLNLYCLSYIGPQFKLRTGNYTTIRTNSSSPLPKTDALRLKSRGVGNHRQDSIETV